MKILLVNKFHWLKGGSEKYYFELAQLLQEHNHEVAFFSMKDEKNLKTGNKEYFVEQFDLNNGSKVKAFDVIYSRENQRIMEKALEDFKPDIVHLNNFQRQLSASIIEPIRKRKIPIIFTAHDVQAICPAITMIDSKNNICEDCIGGKYINCMKKKCNKGSSLKSLLGAVEGYYYRNKEIYTKKIDYIITPSEFYKKQLIKDGIPEYKIKSIHNFIDTSQYELETIDDGYALYIGRLAREKGIINLVKAFKKLKIGNLYIAGDGPEKEGIINFIKENNLENRIKMLGFLNKEEVKEVIRKCKFVVVPSIGYENCPYSIMETLAIGKPVVGANIGGIPELVKDEKSGFTYNFDDMEELAKKMKILFNDEKLINEYGKNAKKQATELYNKEIYYSKLVQIYEDVRKEKQNER